MFVSTGSPRKIAVSLVPHPDYREGILAGVRRFARVCGGAAEIVCVETPKELRQLSCDGVLANIQDETLDVFEALKVPVVKIGARREFSRFSSVQMDNESVGRLGACHLLTHGYAQFGFLGIMGQSYARERQLAFESQITAFGSPSITLSIAEAEELSMESGPLVRLWLSSIKGPSAVMAGSDLLGRRLIELCKANRIRVPEDTAVLGFNNGLLECLGAEPHLSSITQEREILGYKAAEILWGHMEGALSGIQKILVPARRVETRASTRAFLYEDAALNALLDTQRDALLAALRDNGVLVAEDFYIPELAAYFRKNATGNDLRQSALRAQVLIVERLLRQTLSPLHRVAEVCGIDEAQRFEGLFKLAFDIAPQSYRERFADSALPAAAR